MAGDDTETQNDRRRLTRYAMIPILRDATPLDPEEFARIVAAHAEFLAGGEGGGAWTTIVTTDSLDLGIVMGLYKSPGGAIGRREGQAMLGGKRLAGLDLRGVQLAYADLCGVSCREQDLSGANLTGSLLVDSDLSASCFRGANLAAADLSRCELVGCNFREADLRGADLEQADLTDADLRGARLDGARFPGALLAGVRGLPIDIA